MTEMATLREAREEGAAEYERVLSHLLHIGDGRGCVGGMVSHTDRGNIPWPRRPRTHGRSLDVRKHAEEQRALLEHLDQRAWYAIQGAEPSLATASVPTPMAALSAQA